VRIGAADRCSGSCCRSQRCTAARNAPLRSVFSNIWRGEFSLRH
jgi:hypothetical protein